MFELVGSREVHGVERITAGKRVWGLVPMTVHCYRLGATLIDAGTPHCAGLVRDHLAEQRVDHVLLTHQHEDHVGAAAVMAEAGAAVFAPRDALSVLAGPPQLPRYRDSVWGRPRPVQATAFADKLTTDDGVFEVVEAPGHSPDHVVLHEPERGWLFSGDAVLGQRKELRFDEDLWVSMESYARLRALDPAVLFPGHGGVIDDASRALDALVAYYEHLWTSAWRLRDQGASISRITRELLGREGFIRAYTGGEFSKENLTRQLLRRQP